MKRLFAILFAVVFLVGFTFAQNTDTTSQTGNSNIAKTTQTGTNHAQTIQEGNLQNATITQNGTNVGGIYQLDNGNGNQATLSQDGYKNDASINQGMDAGYWSDYQTVGANYNHSTLTQTGNHNQGYLEQYGGSNSTNGNTANLTQTGNGNKSYGYQGWAYSGWNETWTESHLQSYNSTINISQINNNNEGNVWQYGGNNNNVTISQDGNSNLASVTQGFIYTDANYTFTTPVYNTVNNNASITQTGDNNHGKVMQLGNDNSFRLSQGQGSWVGYDPSATGLEASRNAYFHQDGNNNKFAGVNKSGDNISFKGSADAEQINGAKLDAISEGITGYYGSFQKGDNNKIGLRQYNDNALMQQIGNSNSAVLWQGGTAVNDATILQNGNSNTATVLQQ